MATFEEPIQEKLEFSEVDELGKEEQQEPQAEIGRAHVELQSHSDLVCRLLLEKKK